MREKSISMNNIIKKLSLQLWKLTNQNKEISLINSFRIVPAKKRLQERLYYIMILQPVEAAWDQHA